MTIALKTIRLARHYGFCMGVKRAIRIAEKTGDAASGPVNVIHDIVHNDEVVKKLAARNVGSVGSMADVPGGTIIISAHGAPPALFCAARQRGLTVVDATCPLVIRIHRIIQRLVASGHTIIHFGDLQHDETRAVTGQAPDGCVTVIHSSAELHQIQWQSDKYALTSQTTADAVEFEAISQEAKKLFPGIQIFNTICNATNHRQAAVLALAPEVDLMLIVGSESSANSKRLRNISETVCGRAYLINSIADLDEAWLDGVLSVGVSAGASTPDFLVENVVERLVQLSQGRAEVIRPEENRGRRSQKQST